LEDDFCDKDWRFATFCPAFEKMFSTYSPAHPVIVFNGGPTHPPYPFETIPLEDPYLPHGRGGVGHYGNCWKAIGTGMRYLKAAGYDIGVFISQWMLIGHPLLPSVPQDMQDADILCNDGCGIDPPYGLHSEFIAANLHTTDHLWGCTYQFPLESALRRWCDTLHLKRKNFSMFWHGRESPLGSEDNYAFHCTHEEYERFIKERHLE